MDTLRYLSSRRHLLTTRHSLQRPGNPSELHACIHSGKRRFLKWSLAATATAALAACGGGDDEPIPTPDIVGVLQADPQFSILVEAVVAAGLVDTLKSPGPFTEFAPSNTAFAALLVELKIVKGSAACQQGPVDQSVDLPWAAGKFQPLYGAGWLVCDRSVGQQPKRKPSSEWRILKPRHPFLFARGAMPSDALHSRASFGIEPGTGLVA